MQGVDTLPPYTPGQFPTLGPALVVWALENGIKVLDGKLAGKPFIPTPSQYRFLAHWYRIFPQGHPDEGEFYYRGGGIRLSRGSLKSPLGGFIGTIDTVGPSRFNGWNSRDRYGNLLGKRPSMALCQIAAVSEAQTQNTFNYVAGWTAKDTELAAKYGLDAGKTQVFCPSEPGIAGGKISIVTSSAATVRGSRPSTVIADELSEWLESNGGVRFWDVIVDNATKVDGARVLGLMNTWVPGAGSVAEMLYDTWVAEQSGEVVNERPLLYWSREASPDTDWSDPDSIAEALAYIYAECPWVNQKQILSTILSPSKPITSSMREFGNLIISDLSSWVSKQSWDACASDETLEAADEIVLALDPAITEDCTALLACRVSDGLVHPLYIHDPGKSGDLDVAELDRQVKLAFDAYKVLAFASDAHPLEGRVFVDWAQEYGDRLLIDASSKGPIAFDMRALKLDFARAAELAASEIEDGSLKHTGDPVLSRHVINAQRRPYREFVSLGRGARERKIDAAISMVLARHIRRMVLESPAYEKRKAKSRVIVFR